MDELVCGICTRKGLLPLFQIYRYMTVEISCVSNGLLFDIMEDIKTVPITLTAEPASQYKCPRCGNDFFIPRKFINSKRKKYMGVVIKECVIKPICRNCRNNEEFDIQVTAPIEINITDDGIVLSEYIDDNDHNVTREVAIQQVKNFYRGKNFGAVVLCPICSSTQYDYDTKSEESQIDDFEGVVERAKSIIGRR